MRKPGSSRSRSVFDPVSFLAALPTRRRMAILAYVNAIHTEDLEPLAIFLKGRHPDASDKQIARMCGVSRAELNRWELYRATKPRLADYSRVRRQPTQWRAKGGERWPLDHPDRDRV